MISTINCKLMTVFLLALSVANNAEDNIEISYNLVNARYQKTLIISNSYIVKICETHRDSQIDNKQTKQKLLKLVNQLKTADCPNIMDGSFAKITHNKLQLSCNNCTSCNNDKSGMDTWETVFEIYREIDCKMDSSRISNNSLTFADSIRMRSMYYAVLHDRQTSLYKNIPLDSAFYRPLKETAGNLKKYSTGSCREYIQK